MSSEETTQYHPVPITVGLVTFFLLVLVQDSFWMAVGGAIFLAFFVFYAANYQHEDERWK